MEIPIQGNGNHLIPVLFQGPDLFESLVFNGQHGFRPGEVEISLRSQAHTMPASHKQSGIQFRFQVFQLLTQGRWSDKQPLRCPGNTLFLLHCDYIFKLLCVHRYPSFPAYRSISLLDSPL